MAVHDLIGGLFIFGVVLAFLCCIPWRCGPRPERERRAAATALAAHEVQAARLPYFPYAAQDGASVRICAICLEPLRHGQLCSEGLACHHVFHRDCLGAWAKNEGTCPLCRATIMPASDAVAAADDMV
ncbi:hypothetical protein EJB05_45357, partial [Eragrostis curvula]